MEMFRRRKSSEVDNKLLGLELNQDSEMEIKSDVRGDRLNIALLLFLYTLQGIPLGLIAAIPMLLINRGISYKEQAEYSFVYWPFSLKLLWAPIVDALYWKQIGRRKTWLVPAQYFLGIGMLILSTKVDAWLEDEPDIIPLTSAFFILNFLAATQDIAVDGWALTMLKRCNVGHASTCNSVGQTAGYFLGYVVFIALESADFCNSYLRSEPQSVGIVTLSWFLQMWGWIFIISTTLVMFFKKEDDDTHLRTGRGGGEGDRGKMNRGDKDSWRKITSAYKQLYEITKLRPVRLLALVLLTAKIGFSASDAVSGLKLVEAGVPREQLALLIIPLVPIQVLLPLILSKHTTGPEPLNSWLKAYPYRVIFGIVAALVVWLTPFLLSTTPLPVYLAVLLTLYALHQVCLFSMFVAVMAFFARVSDPMVGGTYMTLLNTLSNLGGNWPNTLALWAVDPLSQRSCGNLPFNATELLRDNLCITHHEKLMCAEGGGSCLTHLDGFYVETVICFVVGMLWYHWGKHAIRKLQRMPLSRWQLAANRH